MYLVVFYVLVGSAYCFLLETNSTQSGGQNVARYLTLSQFYDTKSKLQNDLDQIRGDTKDLRHEVDMKLSLLTSQLQQILSTFQHQVANNGIVNDNKTLEALEEKYNELLTKNTKLQSNFETMQKIYAKQSVEILALKNFTKDLIKLQGNFESLQKMYLNQEKELRAMKNSTSENLLKIEDLQSIKSLSQAFDLRELQQKVDSINSQTQTLRVNEQARNQDFQALYNLTIDSGKQTNNRLNEVETRSNSSLKAVKQEVAKNSERVALTACVGSDIGNKSVGQIIKFDDIRSQRNINNLSSFKRSGKFTCESDGLYLVSAWILSYINYSEFAVYKNGNHIAYGYIKGDTDSFFTSTTVVAVELQLYDTVWIQPSNKLFTHGNQRSCLTIIKVK